MYAYYAGADQPYQLSETPIANAAELGLLRILGIINDENRKYVFSAPDGIPPARGSKKNDAEEVRLEGMFPKQVALTDQQPPSSNVMCLLGTYNPVADRMHRVTSPAKWVKLSGLNRWELAKGQGVEKWKPAPAVVPAQDQPPSASVTATFRDVWRSLTRKMAPAAPDPRPQTRCAAARLVS